MLENRIKKAQKIVNEIKYSLGSINTLNRLEDLQTSEGKSSLCIAQDIYINSPERNILVEKAFAADRLVRTSELRLNELKKLKVSNPPQPGFFNDYTTLVDTHIASIVSEKKKNIEASIEARLALKLFDTGMGLERKKFICTEFSMLVLEKMKKLDFADSYATLSFSRQTYKGSHGSLSHEVVVLGLAWSESVVLETTETLEVLCRKNPCAVVIDLWNKEQEVFPLSKLEDKLKVLVLQSQISPIEDSSYNATVSFFIPNTYYFMDTLQSTYPLASDEMQKNQFLLFSQAFQSVNGIDWCEPPPGSVQDELNNTVVPCMLFC